MVSSILVLCGWSRVNIQELLPAVPASFCGQPPANAPLVVAPLSAYAILEKASASLTRLKSVRLDMDLWLQDAATHIRTNFTSTIQNVDEYKTDGRISVSLTVPQGVSSSEWVQTFEIGGIPFTWDREKREWKQEELAITGKDAKAVLAYGVLRSLFTVNENSVERDSIRLLCVEQRNNRDCYVVGYTMDPRVFARKGVVGDVTVKLWIDTQQFLPYVMRAEGEISDMYMLQTVTYSGFNAQAALQPPAAIADQVKEQKEQLKGKIKELTKAVAEIRGWKSLDTIDTVFYDRVAMRAYLEQEFEKDTAGENIPMIELVYKWLGLMPPDASYKDYSINAEISSIAALYDPALKKILIGEWLHPAVAEPVLAHEICHAYQDRYFDLQTYMRDDSVRTDLDKSFARHTLVEGDATAVMLEYLLRQDKKSFKDLGDIFSFIEDKVLRDDQDAKQNIIYSLYGYGANYIQYYLKENPWQQIDALYKDPPESMSEILHPYTLSFARNRPSASAGDRGGVQPALEAPWRPVWTNHIGEFLLQMSLREFLDKDASQLATRGWKSDTLTVYQHPAQGRLIVLGIRWEKAENAQGFLSAYKTYLGKRFSGISFEDKGAYTTVRTGDQGKLALIGKDDAVTVVWGDQLNSEEFNGLIKKLI